MIRDLIRKPGSVALIMIVGIMIFGTVLLSYETADSQTKGGFLNKSAESELPVSFNHDATSFPLLGAHRGLKCSLCHLGGQYKSAPRTCENCHNDQIAYGKSKNHIMTTQSCNLCHSVSAWSPSTFDHKMILATGQCSTCHNDQKAKGKPQNHITTRAQCDTCHKMTGWTPATFVHDAKTAGQCSTCHNGEMAKGKPSNHMGTSSECNLCHAGTTTKRISAEKRRGS
ncbi:MAG: hypothetical protein HY204_03155 [Nitrospirae bacterium]|nr:hypothetical protein [Nitrospirota bacterium]